MTPRSCFDLRCPPAFGKGQATHEPGPVLLVLTHDRGAPAARASGLGRRRHRMGRSDLRGLAVARASQTEPCPGNRGKARKRDNGVARLASDDVVGVVEQPAPVVVELLHRLPASRASQLLRQHDGGGKIEVCPGTRRDIAGLSAPGGRNRIHTPQMPASSWPISSLPLRYRTVYAAEAQPARDCFRTCRY